MGLAGFIAAQRHLLSMQLNQWKSAEELKEIQERKLAALLRHASRTVPHYRKSLKGKTASSLSDLQALPMVHKEEARDAASLTSGQYRAGELKKGRTSGSTGIPLTVMFSESELAYSDAQRYFQHSVAGIGLLDKVAFLTYKEEQAALFRDLFGVRNLPFTEEEGKSLRALKSMRPSALVSYPSCLVPLAKGNISSGAGFRVGAVISSAECLPGAARKLISDSFGCRVFDRYGTIEAGTVAFECEKGRKHLCQDSIIAEILDEAGSPARTGEYGELVLTPLWRYSMPFIRYRIGDRAAFGGRCPCGRAHQTIEQVRGRSNAFIVLRGGRRFPGFSAGLNLRHMHGVLQFQVIQEEAGSLRILVVPGGERAPASLREEAAACVKRVLPAGMEISVEVVDRLERSSEAKASEFVSRLPADPDSDL